MLRPKGASHSSAMFMSCKLRKAAREKPPLTRLRVTQLSYPIIRTDPELSADVSSPPILP
jgi:hypothetical protein